LGDILKYFNSEKQALWFLFVVGPRQGLAMMFQMLKTDPEKELITAFSASK
jgi:hypothetical protein